MLKALSDLENSRLDMLRLEIAEDAIWEVNTINTDKITKGEINWGRFDIGKYKKYIAQKLLLNIWEPEIKNGSYVLKNSSYRMHKTLLRLMCLFENLYSGCLIHELEKNDLVKVFVVSAFSEWNDFQSFERKLIKIEMPLSYQIVDKQISILRIWYTHYHSGFVSDGPEYDIDMRDLQAPLAEELKKLNIPYMKWKDGSTYGSVNFAVAHLLLSDAIEKIQSPQTKQLLEYFKLAREITDKRLIKVFWKAPKNTPLGRYRSSGDFSFLKEGEDAEDADLCQASRLFALPLHNKLIEIAGEPNDFMFPWKNYIDLRQNQIEILIAAYIIFLTVMGKRGPSEVLTLRAVDIVVGSEQGKKKITMYPSIFKTNMGLREAQGITTFVDDAFQILLNISYSEKKNTELPIFSTLPSSLDRLTEAPQRLSTAYSCALLHNYYENFCLRITDKIEDNIFDLHPKITSHQFRHAFAEFALRRFDGNIEELIRLHFCHQYNHWWTKRYTADKLDANYQHQLFRNYVRELIPRIILDSYVEPDFVGGMALYIKKQFGEKISGVSPQEFDEQISMFCDDFIDLTPHEYGWCLVHKNYRSSAQCADETGIPNPGNTDSSKCNACANFCSSKISHLSTQKQIAINHIDFLEQNLFKSAKLRESSKKAVKNAQLIFPELRELGNVDDY